MAAEVILRVKVDRSQYNAFKAEVKKGIDPGTDGVSKSLKDMGEQAQQATSKIQSLGEMLTKKIAWYSISMAITSVTTAFKEALTEIKNVDTQLTNIAKVSGKSMEDLQGLAEKAYSTASKYGVEASKYMEAVYEYTKAGFQDNADAMAELSTKAMLVGDTTAAVADKFLISANAAWNYGKNVEQLSLLVDRADYINNNYATTFDKIADGFPRVASVASMAGMSAEQTMAALGTITATTQETASRAGTALRALILNILGDTTTEVEDGVTNTQEEIDSLRKVMEIYAKDVVDAADATGSLINPMEAIASLSKAYREGALTEKELFTIEKALGGKLRTNQLDALLKNFETTYTSMMQGMAGALGTADKEIEIMLGSWEAKSNILKNTWTEFVSKGLNSQLFKDAIDKVTILLDRFDGLNQILPSIVLSMVALFAPAVAQNADTYIKKIRDLATAIKTVGAGAKLSAQSIPTLIGTAASLVATVAAIAYTAWKNHVQKIKQEAEDATEDALQKSKTAIQTTQNITDLYKAYKEAEAANDGSTAAKQALTTATENLAAALGIEKDAIDGVTKSWDELTKEELDRQRQAVEDAVTIAKSKIISAGWTYSDNPIMSSARGAGTRGAEGVWYGQGSPYGEEDPAITQGVRVQTGSQEDNFIRAVAAYKTTQKKLQAYRIAQTANSYEDIQYADLTHGVDSVQADWIREAFKKYENDSYGLQQEISKLESDIAGAPLVAKYIEAKEALDAYNKTVDEFGADSKEAADAAADAAKKEKELAQAAREAAADQKKVSDAFATVKGNATEATEALEKYKKALESDTTEDTMKGYVEAWSAGFEDYQKGLKDSAKIRALADLVLSEKEIREIKKRGDSLADAVFQNPLLNRIYIKGYETDESGVTKPVFRDELEAAKEFAAWIKEFDTDENGLITRFVGDTSEVAARLLETDDGLKIIVEDWDLLSEQTGLSIGQLKALMGEYGLLFDGLEASARDLYALASEIGALNLDGKIDIGKIIANRAAAGDTEEDIRRLVDRLIEADQNGEINLDFEYETAEEAKDVLYDVISEATDLNGKLVEIEVTAENKATAVLTNVQNQLNGLPTYKNIDVVATYQKYDPNSVENILNFYKHAKGTDNAPGGATLVNEEGPELILEKGKARIAGGGHPTITNLQKGAKVWTAKETKAILGNSNLDELYDGIHAYASGTPSTIANVARTTWGEYSRWNADVSDNQHLKYLQSIVTLRKAELELIEESGGSISWQVEKMGTIQTALLNEIKHLQAIGGSQEDIVKLTAEWYQIQNKIADMTAPKIIEASELYSQLQKSINKQVDDIKDKRDAELEAIDKQIEALQKAHDVQADTNELKEKELAVTKAQQELDNAKAQRTVRVWNAAKGRWEWTYNASNVKSATENLTSAKQALTDYKNEQAYQKKIDDLEAKQLTISQKYNTQIEKWQKVLDSIEEPVKSISASMKELLKYTTSEMSPTVTRIKQAFAKNGLTFDSGGVLRGLGGIKATSADEVILPPDVTKKMLSPVSSKMFSQRLNELRYIYGATGNLAGYTNNAIGSQHNGDIYTFGNVTLSTEQAKNTTVYDLVRMARGLRSYASAI